MKQDLVNLNGNSTNVRPYMIKRQLTLMTIYLLWFLVPFKIKQFILTNFFAPRKYKTSPVETEFLKKCEKYELNVNNQKLKCWKYGTGPALIFVHGWNGRGIQFHSFFKTMLDAGFSLVFFDGPGHGESDGRTSSYFQMTDAARAVINDIGPENIVALLGHSFGAAAIINSLEKENLSIPAILFAPALYLKELLDKAFDLHGIPFKIFRSIINDYEKKYGYVLEKDNPVKILERYPIDALIVHDSEDRVTPYNESVQIAEQQNNLKIHSTSGLGHKKILNDKEVIKNSVDFITSQNKGL